MASETTFDHWKVVFSWGKMRKSRFSQNPLNTRFWAFGFWIYTSSSANFKKIHHDTFVLSHSMFLPLVPSQLSLMIQVMHWIKFNDIYHLCPKWLQHLKSWVLQCIESRCLRRAGGTVDYQCYFQK